MNSLEKITHDLVQGTEAWNAFRLQHFGASEAAAMLGLSKKVTRPQLLQAKKTGIAREFSDWLQANVLDYGHEVEALARPLAEAIIGDDLYPVTCSRGKLSASCDGITLDDTIAFEHKQWNEGLAAVVAAGAVPDEHMPQCQQILLVTGAEKVIFTVSDGTPGKMVYTKVLPDQAWFDRLVRGWAQFEADLETFEPPAATTAPAPTGRAPESLPALLVQVTGAVTASNLVEFKEIALSAIRSVNRELTTDQHFADAAKAVKWCSDVEERIDAAKEHALSQTSSIDALFKVMDDIKTEARQTRLDLDRLVKARNVALKTEIVTAAHQALAKHIAGLNDRLSHPMPPVPADFAGAIHGKKSFDSMRAALDATLANAKVFANEVADRIDANLKHLREHADGYQSLFPDTAVIVLKAADDLQALVASRIAAHKDAEEKRLEAERARIRAEEQAKAEKEAREKLAAEQAQQQPSFAPATLQREETVAPAAKVVPMSRPTAPPVDTGARIKLGEINAAIAPLAITAIDAEAKPVARMLTDEELAECCGGCKVTSAAMTWMRRSVSKFAEVNGLTIGEQG
jgi:predicted phage-related endonuclease